MFEAETSVRGGAAFHAGLDEYIFAIAAGDRSALAELYSKTRSAVYGFVLSIVKNTADAEDALQDTYVKLWSAAPEYRSQGKPLAWIFTIARNNANSLLRERGKTAELPEEDWSSAFAYSPTVTSDDRMVLKAAMSGLSDEERQIVMLHAVSGLKHIEIAKLLSLPLSTVLSKYSRARKKLQNILEEGETA